MGDTETASQSVARTKVGDFGYDAIVIGTGFGGAVAATRLTQAGARVLILERGMRYSGEAFPPLPRDGQVISDMARWVWNSEEGRLGLWDVRDLDGTHAASAAGYGGGSLVYASVHLRAPNEVLERWPQLPGHEHTRAALDPYYDLAAHMLEVDTIESAAPKLYPLRKTSALRAAAAELGRAGQTFFPPLAVRFQDGPDRLGRERRGCVGCGECDSGCRFGAKNSLDLSYLAIAERMRAGDAPHKGFPRGAALPAGEPLAVVRTLAEARAITRCKRLGVDGFEVEFLDHTALDQARVGRHRLDEKTRPRTERASAPFVFVCAGAVGSTELLLRNQKELGIASEALGQSYFGNSDALGIVRNAKHVQAPHVGPVITTALVHRGQRADDPWLMIQDGGYGAAVHALVEAVFASPVLGQRNRFYEGAPRIAPPHLEEGPSKAEPYLAPPLPVRRNASLGEGLYRVEMAHQLTAIIPPQLAGASIMLRDRVEAFVASDIEKTVDALERFVVEGGAYRLAKIARGTVVEAQVQRAARYVLGLLAKVVRKLTASGALAAIEHELERKAEPSPPTPEARKRMRELEAFVREHAIGVATMMVMKDRFQLSDQRRAFMEALKLLSQYTEPAERAKSLDHTAVLLTMGRDQQRHRLQVKGKVLVAEMDRRERGEQRLYAVQERLMRELASVMGGELRLNPAWSQAHTPITVHGQGGCGMAIDPKDGATTPQGEVHGCPGLFVMDAALFPSPVGVNPSATILAIAERNIEAFIRKRPGLHDFVAPEAHAARSIDPARRARLTPAAIDTTQPSPAIETKAVGIRFDERMYGFHSSRCNAPAIVGAELDGTRHTERLYSALEACYIEGRRAEDALELVLQAEIGDLSGFLADPHRRGKLTGTLQLMSRDPNGPGLHPRLREHLNAAGGSLAVHTGEIELLAKVKKDERVFRYLLTFRSPLPDGRDLVLEGHKRLRDEPGQDEWQDTTALFFWLAEVDHYDQHARPIADKDVRSHGVVRVSLDEFLYKQLPSIEVINVRNAPGSDQPDPANVVWAAATFGKFFFGSLADVYMKEAALVTRVVKRSLKLDGGAS